MEQVLDEQPIDLGGPVPVEPVERLEHGEACLLGRNLLIVCASVRSSISTPGQDHELVEALDPFTERRAAITHPQCVDQLFACCHADLPRHVVLLPPDNPTGSKLREAIGQHE